MAALELQPVQLDGNCILGACIAFMWVVYVWETYITLRQRAVYANTPKVPSHVEDLMDQETFNKARLYQLDKTNFSLVKGIFTQVESTVVLLMGILPFLWKLSGNLIEGQGYPAAEYEILCSGVFSVIGAFISTILGLPWSLYSTFVIEERHGFNKQTLGFFVKDQIKQFLVFQTISVIVMSGLIYIIKTTGDYFFLYCWIFVLVVSVIMVTIYPVYIAPLFDKYTPLEEGELKTKIEDLAASIKFPLTKLYVVDGSKRSNHSNAYFYGFFKNKRIVLFDTLLENYTLPSEEKPSTEDKDDTTPASDEPEKSEELSSDGDKTEGTDKTEETEEKKKKGCTDDEVVAILSHELGHWYLNHVLKNFFIGQVNVLFCFIGLAYLIKYNDLYTSFGFYDEQPVIIGLVVIFSYIFAPYNEVFGLCMTMISRRFEFQADEFGRKLGKSELLQSALIKLHKDNLGFPVVDWLYSLWTYSHPPLLERLAALKKSD